MILNTARDGVSIRVNTHNKAPGHEDEAMSACFHYLRPLMSSAKTYNRLTQDIQEAIILGTILMPLATNAGIHPIQFAMIGVVSLAFGLVTPPYGLCLLIACAIGETSVIETLKDVFIILLPMLLILGLLIFFPECSLFIPRLIKPGFL